MKRTQSYLRICKNKFQMNNRQEDQPICQKNKRQKNNKEQRVVKLTRIKK